MERDRERALKRGGGAVTLSLDLATGEENYRLQVSEEMTPEDVYERRWALTVLDRAVGRLERESDEAGTSFQFEHLQQYLTGEGVPPSYRETATALGMSEAATKSAVQRLRRRLGRCLRTEIAETVADPADVDDEVRNLLSKLRP